MKPGGVGGGWYAKYSSTSSPASGSCGGIVGREGSRGVDPKFNVSCSIEGEQDK